MITSQYRLGVDYILSSNHYVLITRRKTWSNTLQLGKIMNDFDDTGSAGEFSYVFEDEDSFLDNAEELLFDEYYAGEEEEPVGRSMMEDPEIAEGFDAVSLGMGLSLGAELAAEERQKAELLNRLNEIKVPIDIDENTDKENIAKAQQLTSLHSGKTTKYRKTEFDKFLDDIYSGRKSLWDD